MRAIDVQLLAVLRGSHPSVAVAGNLRDTALTGITKHNVALSLGSYCGHW
jgi:hypothetical protein